MSSQLNGYRHDREDRPSSEQMVDLHVYLVPPDIWRNKFNNALNQNINDTVSLGFIRTLRDTRVSDLRDEIDQQLGLELVPRSYVFLKSVGRSLTRLKAKQEYQLKVKNFLPPQAYAPELYLLEATPEVRAALAASSSEGSTRPQTRTSIQELETYRPSESYRQRHRHSRHDLDNGEGEGHRAAKYNSVPNGGGHLATNPYSPLPQITPRYPHPSDQPFPHQAPYPGQQSSPSHSQHSKTSKTNGRPLSPQQYPHHLEHASNPHPHHPETRHVTPPAIRKTSASPHASGSHRSNGEHNGHQSYPHTTDAWDDIPNNNNTNATSPPNPSNRDKHPADSDPTPIDPYSPRRNALDKKTEDYLPPLSATPPQSASAKDGSSSKGQQLGHRTNRDSGIAALTPDDTYRENQNDVLDRRKEDQENGTSRLQPPSPVRDEEEEQLRRLRQDHDGQEWDRQRQEQQDRQRKEEHDRINDDKDDRRKAEKNREKMAGEAAMTRTASDEDLNKFPSPPPLRLASPERDTASARARRKKEKPRQTEEELMRELQQAREERHAAEKMREELVRRAKQMQSKTQNRRNYARDVWKKRYFEEKKKTGPFEEQTNRLRHELDIIHKRLMTTLEGPKEKATKLQDFKLNPKVGSPKALNNFKIQATRLQHELEDVRRRVDHAKMRLTGEMKLRNQAETELRALRAELTQKKINLTLSRNSHLTSYAPPATDMNFMSARTAPITPKS